MTEDLYREAETWMADDPDPATRTELSALLARARAGQREADEELRDAFSGLLQFGTAGLRGAMGPGPHRMNLAVVSRAARGLADYLLSIVDGTPRVTVGYDARHNSKAFAEATASIMTAAGVEALLMPDAWPTPLLAFSVRHLDADAGVMVTASHNPARDNGYKVYLGGRSTDADGRGVQIVPPADADIAARIAAVPDSASIPRAASGWTVLTEELRQDYLAAITPLVTEDAPRDVRIVHTSMHGVGHETVMKAFDRAGFHDVTAVAEQAKPDPDFPTVSFPNPEEKGAIDLALADARRLDADLVIANDPDADRCAAAVLDPHLGQWRMLRGDELGVLLGSFLMRRGDGHGTIANSIVSSRWLSKAAARAGYRAQTTLTGFKWIARTPGIVYGYEEAIGYCVAPEVVKDKDGLSTALVLAEIAARAKADGTTLIGILDDLARADGLHATDQLAVRVDDLALIGDMMAVLRAHGIPTLAGSPVVATADLAEGTIETTGLPPTDGLSFTTEDDTRVIVRPSGTEPKLKCYLEVVEPVAAHADFDALGAARRRAADRLAQVRADVSMALGVA